MSSLTTDFLFFVWMCSNFLRYMNTEWVVNVQTFVQGLCEGFLAEIPLRSPWKLFIFIIKKYVFWDQSIQKLNNLILKKKNTAGTSLGLQLFARHALRCWSHAWQGSWFCAQHHLLLEGWWWEAHVQSGMSIHSQKNLSRPWQHCLRDHLRASWPGVIYTCNILYFSPANLLIYGPNLDIHCVQTSWASLIWLYSMHVPLHSHHVLWLRIHVGFQPVAWTLYNGVESLCSFVFYRNFLAGGFSPFPTSGGSIGLTRSQSFFVNVFVLPDEPFKSRRKAFICII